MLVLGAEADLVARALAGLPGDGTAIVLDASAERLEALRATCSDARVWYAIGEQQVIPLPDGSVDGVVGEVDPSASSELARVLVM